MPKTNKTITIEITPEQFLNSCSDMELNEIYHLIQLPRYANRMKGGMREEKRRRELLANASPEHAPF